MRKRLLDYEEPLLCSKVSNRSIEYAYKARHDGAPMGFLAANLGICERTLKRSFKRLEELRGAGA